MVREFLLDAADMEPPEPLVRAQDLVSELNTGDYIRFRHRREPYMLYDNLKQSGFSFITCTGNDVAYEVFIWREGDVEAQSASRTKIQAENLSIQFSSIKNTDS